MMMNFKKKNNLALAVIGITVLAFFLFPIYFLFNQIQKESENFITQRDELAKLEAKTQNFEKFQKDYWKYQPALAKINNLFIDSAEPIDFIEFLEQEAKTQQLAIEISPFLQEAREPWPSMNFRLTLTGTAPNFLRFLERLESSSYLIEVLSLVLGEDPEAEENVIANLIIKAYSK